MTEIKKCKCGGEGHLVVWQYADTVISYTIYCDKCFCATDNYDTETETVEAWNASLAE